MPTAEQSWLKLYETYYERTEQNKKLFGKRIKQLKHMLEDDDFLEWLVNEDNKEQVLGHLLHSQGSFDDYIGVSEYDVPYIQDKDFGLISFIKTLLSALQSDHYMMNSKSRKQAKRYAELYCLYQKQSYDFSGSSYTQPQELPF
jgi:hypothetical protein